jgi:membrane-bound ClpP family serine protease
VTEVIEPGKTEGKVEFRGTQWAARSKCLIAKGTVVKIVARDNLTLSVQPNEEVQTS